MKTRIPRLRRKREPGTPVLVGYQDVAAYCPYCEGYTSAVKITKRHPEREHGLYFVYSETNCSWCEKHLSVEMHREKRARQAIGGAA